MQWMVPISGLNRQQTRVLDALKERPDETHWISGFAGTGKTILVTHCIERIIASTRSASICFLTYTHALKDLVASGLSEVAKKRVTVATVDNFRSLEQHFDYLVVDEIQDVSDELVGLVVRRARRLIVAGDPEQSIYLGRVKPEQLKRLLGGALVHTLKDIERLTQNVFQLANTVLPEAKIRIGALVKDGPKAKMIEGTSKRDEFLKVYREAMRTSLVGLPCAILFPTHSLIFEFAEIVSEKEGWGKPPPREKRGPITDYTAFNQHFSKHRSPLRFLGSDNGSLPESDSVKLIYLLTYHSAKGLDFNNVFLPHLTATTTLDAKVGHFSDWERERRHFFVAITRSREQLYFSYHGERHQLLNAFKQKNYETFNPPRERAFK